MAEENTAQLRKRIESILEIPANEQCIGHFQVATKNMLIELLDRIEKLEKATGAI
jgi:hypothetical protein